MNWLVSLSPYLVLIAAGFLPNEVWRVLGIVVAHGLDESSELIVWVRAVATGLLAGVVAKIILFPPGAPADVPLAVRLSAIAIGFAAFLIARRSVFVGVLVGEAALVLGGFFLPQDRGPSGKRSLSATPFGHRDRSSSPYSSIDDH